MGEMYRIAWRHTNGGVGVNDIDHTKEDADAIVEVLNETPPTAEWEADDFRSGFTYWVVPVVGENAEADAETSAYLVSQGEDGEIPDADPHGDLSKFKNAEVSY